MEGNCQNGQMKSSYGMMPLVIWPTHGGWCFGKATGSKKSYMLGAAKTLEWLVVTHSCSWRKPYYIYNFHYRLLQLKTGSHLTSDHNISQNAPLPTSDFTYREGKNTMVITAISTNGCILQFKDEAIWCGSRSSHTFPNKALSQRLGVRWARKKVWLLCMYVYVLYICFVYLSSFWVHVILYLGVYVGCTSAVLQMVLGHDVYIYIHRVGGHVSAV